MEYLALYRKYRPKELDEVVGQSEVKKILASSVKNGTITHAYLFSGPRGTGKTTMAKILAKMVNCINPVDGNACGECDSCKNVLNSNDVIEIDAASNNGVDEIRDLREKANLVPSSAKYKVYIIDEVHMLSIGAFNALLKTLEEPPEHAIFILATTDPQKVPVTIISRCQCFSFKRISVDTIEDRLKFICKEEKIKIEDEVLKNIAILSDGGLRDALGSLDKLVSYTDKKITMDDFIEVNEIISDKQIDEFISNIMNGNIKSVLSDINTFDTNGKNLIQIVIQILNYSRNLIVDYYISNKKMDYSIDLLQKFTNLINEKMFDIKKSSNTRIFIEMFILKYINDYILNNETEKVVVEKVIETKEKEVNKEAKAVEINKEEVKAEKKVEKVEDDEEFDFDSEYADEDENNVIETFVDKRNIDTIVVDNAAPKILNIKEIMDIRVNNTLAKANKQLLKEETEKFELLKDYTFDQEIGYIVCSLLDSKLCVVSPDNLVISFEYDSNVEQESQNIEKICEVYNKITNSNKNIAIISDNEWEKIKKEYIENLKNKVSYEIKEEPEFVLEEIEKSDIISSSAMELFGDIVEVE